MGNKMYQNSWDVELLPGDIAEYKCYVRQWGGGRAAMVVQIPKDVSLALGIIPGDAVELAVRKVA